MTIEIVNVTKEFAGFRALDDVSVSLEPGSFHALLGANGSGKSTLSKVLSGVHRPDKGEIRIGGQSRQGFPSPNHANAMGVAVVHQEAPLIDNLSVGECMALFSFYPMKSGGIDWPALYERAAARLATYGVDLDPRVLAGSISGSQRALVSLVIALDRVESGLRLLILDEATAALTEWQAAEFLDHVRKVAGPNLAVLMVTHRLAELEGRADTLTILRGGRCVYTGSAAELGDEGIISLMAGPIEAEAESAVSAQEITSFWSLARSEPLRETTGKVPALELLGVSAEDLDGLDLSVAPGEIVGIAGLTDSGLSELPSILSGAAPWRSGKILVNGHSVPMHKGPSGTLRAGIAVLPADRLRDGGIRTLSVSENAILPSLSRWWHRDRAATDLLAHLVRMLDVRPQDPSAKFGTLSGGNQQKVILGKWLSLAPSVLVLNDPTQGVDPNARMLLFATMKAAAQCGVAVILLSTEPDQLALHCHQVYVLRAGRIGECIRGADLTPARVAERSYS